MSGHSRWAQIKHQKGAADQKRGQLFSKLLSAIAAAARTEPNPEFNPRLRTAIQKAKENQVSSENIENAVKRASEAGNHLEELLLEAYGPGGVAILIEAVTDNKNRTIPEIKKILSENGAKWAESGSVQWAFGKTSDQRWTPKFPQDISDVDRDNLEKLVQALESQNDIQTISTNVSQP